MITDAIHNKNQLHADPAGFSQVNVNTIFKSNSSALWQDFDDEIPKYFDTNMFSADGISTWEQ